MADGIVDLPVDTTLLAAAQSLANSNVTNAQELSADLDALSGAGAVAEALADLNEANAALAAATDVHTNAVIASNAADVAAAAALTELGATLAEYGIEMDGDNVQLPNIAPDEGLSAPFNSWFTLFGQFFDHGLDLVNKGGSGTVFIPLQPDDPLYVAGSHTNFMVLTRATVSPGADGVMGTADDVRPVNTTTPFVDQNQTYTSHPSHQVFLRQYVLERRRRAGRDRQADRGRQRRHGHLGRSQGAGRTMLGIQLTDFDVGSVPLLRTDQYGNFIPGAARLSPQVIIGVGVDGIPNTADDVVVSGNPADAGRSDYGRRDPHRPAPSSPTSRTTRFRSASRRRRHRDRPGQSGQRRRPSTTTNCSTRTSSPATAASTRTSA